MANRPSNKPGRPASADERRVATRLTPADVPWIKEVKPTAAHSGTLVDISVTGVMVETSARLLPGRRSTMLLITDDNQRERVEVVVVRTQLVGIGPTGELMYRTGLTFARELPTHLREAVERDSAAKLARLQEAGGAPSASASIAPAAASSAPVAARPEAAPAGEIVVPLEPESLVSHVPPQPHLEGPFDSLWSRPAGSELVAVASVTETGCVAQTPTGASVGEPWTVRIFFTATRQLNLKGTITSVTPDGHQCVCQFVDLSPEVRRALRVEIHGGAGHPRPASAGVAAAGHTPSSNLSVNLSSASVSLTANQW